MSKISHYFKFPLVALKGKPGDRQPTPLKTLELCLAIGIHNAGIGYYKSAGKDKFIEILSEQCMKLGGKFSNMSELNWNVRRYIVGCVICGVASNQTVHSITQESQIVDNNQFKKAPFITIKAKFLWKALDKERYENDPASHDRPSQAESITWNEFRVLCAILSSRVNSSDFTFIGWESIQCRACGFANKASFKASKKLKEHLAPALSHKRIRTLLIKLEKNKFFLKFRLSTGSRGGWSTYSFRHHTRAELAKAVLQWQSFQKGDPVADNRAEDLQISLNNKAKNDLRSLDI